MKKKFKVDGCFLYFSEKYEDNCKKLGYIIDIDGDKMHCLFNDGSHGWHHMPYSQFQPSTRKWSKKKLTDVLEYGFLKRYMDNLTYIELLAKAKKL